MDKKYKDLRKANHQCLNCGVQLSTETTFRCYDCLRGIQDRIRLRTYGITLEQYNSLYKKQMGVCAICYQPETAIDKHRKLKRLSIDHNHITGEIRGLVCGKCNAALGMVRESIEILLSMVEYLKEWEITSHT